MSREKFGHDSWDFYTIICTVARHQDQNSTPLFNWTENWFCCTTEWRFGLLLYNRSGGFGSVIFAEKKTGEGDRKSLDLALQRRDRFWSLVGHRRVQTREEVENPGFFSIDSRKGALLPPCVSQPPPPEELVTVVAALPVTGEGDCCRHWNPVLPRGAVTKEKNHLLFFLVCPLSLLCQKQNKTKQNPFYRGVHESDWCGLGQIRHQSIAYGLTDL